MKLTRIQRLDRCFIKPLCIAGSLLVIGSSQVSNAAMLTDGEYAGDFNIVGDLVIPDTQFTARIRVLGTEITYGGQYDIPVTARIRIGSESFEPFGLLSSATGGNINDDNNPREFILPSQFAGGTNVWAESTSWVKRRSYYDGSQDTHWRELMVVDTRTTTPQVLTLRNGDAVPDIPAFMNQDSLPHILRDYINTTDGTMSLQEYEVIYLFELGTSNTDSLAADFQDLVVLVTLAELPEFFEEPDVPRNVTAIYD